MEHLLAFSLTRSRTLMMAKCHHPAGLRGGGREGGREEGRTGGREEGTCTFTRYMYMYMCTTCLYIPQGYVYTVHVQVYM